VCGLPFSGTAGPGILNCGGDDPSFARRAIMAKAAASPVAMHPSWLGRPEWTPANLRALHQGVVKTLAGKRSAEHAICRLDGGCVRRCTRRCYDRPEIGMILTSNRVHSFEYRELYDRCGSCLGVTGSVCSQPLCLRRSRYQSNTTSPFATTDPE